MKKVVLVFRSFGRYLAGGKTGKQIEVGKQIEILRQQYYWYFVGILVRNSYQYYYRCTIFIFTLPDIRTTDTDCVCHRRSMI